MERTERTKRREEKGRRKAVRREWRR